MKDIIAAILLVVVITICLFIAAGLQPNFANMPRLLEEFQPCKK